MSLFELILLSLALAVDNFTVCLLFGLQRHEFKTSLREGEVNPFPPVGGEALKAALVFAVLHIAMILLGWFLGKGMSAIIRPYDFWVAFALISGIGLKTVIDAFNGKEKNIKVSAMYHFKSLLLLGIATGIDAFAVGIGLKMLSLNLTEVCSFTASAVFLCSFLACLFGYCCYNAMRKCPLKLINIIAGIALIGIGLRILFANLAA